MGCCIVKSKRKSSKDYTHRTTGNRADTPRAQRAEDMKFSVSAVVFHKQSPIIADYDVGAKLGKGAFGTVRRVVHKATGHSRAVKSVMKSMLHEAATKETRFTNEIDILRSLNHPNIIKLHEFYEDKHCYYLVTELLTGGELFDFILEHQMLSEGIAACFTKQLLAALNYCHSSGIVHRDIKAENLILQTTEPDAMLKLIDFGNATRISPGQQLNHIVGTAYYVAPEVLAGAYDSKCDVWSCGVILHLLLCGRPPFCGNCEEEIFASIAEAKLDMAEPVWSRVSAEAKDLVRKMLTRNPALRPGPGELLSHPWFKEVAASPTLSSDYIAETIDYLKRFRAESKLQQAVLAFITHQLISAEDTKHLNAAFKAIDTNGDGKLSREELVKGYSLRMDPFEAVEEVSRIMKEVDIDANGFIEYSEFVAASLKKDRLLSVENLEATFRAFDIDHNGTISASELRELLGRQVAASDSVWVEVIAQVDENGDGELDIHEFKEMMLKLF